MKIDNENRDLMTALPCDGRESDAQKINSLCCVAAGITDPLHATTEVQTPHKTLRGAANEDDTLIAQSRPPAQLVMGYKRRLQDATPGVLSNVYRIHPQLGINFEGLVIDNFAGGGGASTGIEMGLGRPVDIAINHAPDAIAMHVTNHPHTRHFCESVWTVDPRLIADGVPVDLCWFSPDCKHFSKAKGSKPVSKNIRGLAWVALRYAATVKPRVIILENVEEFTTWGPLGRDERPVKKQKGRTFNCFVNALRRQLYKVEWRELRACDYGAATTRKRLFMINRRDEAPIVWPAPTHGHPESTCVKQGRLKPWRTAGDIIDWSIPFRSIFAPRKKPIAEKTLQRIARGLKRYVIESNKPYVVKHQATFITEHANGSSQRNMPADEPLRTICAEVKGGHFALVTAFLAKHYGGNYTGSGCSLTDPLPTITTIDHNALVTAHIQRDFGNSVGHAADEPLHTITAGGGGKAALVQAFLIKYYGQISGQSLHDPLHTITTHDRMGLVMIKGEPWRIADIGMRMLEPHELYAAQGFPADYIHDHLADGTKLSKKAQVRMVGNSVCPPMAAALVRANFRQGDVGEVAA